MKDLMGMMKQAKQMQAKLAEAQSQMATIEARGESGAGMVGITLYGNGQAKDLTIDPSLVDAEDVEILEDLIVAAINDARSKLEVAQQDAMKDAMGGMQLPPGMGL